MGEVRRIEKFPRGVVRIPPSKSVAHRAVICAGLAEGTSTIENIAFSQDITATAQCMQALGAVCHTEGNRLTVKGNGKKKDHVLDCGESGSTLRFLIPVAALLDEEITFTGKGRLMERPLTPYMDTLQRNGVSIAQQGELRVKGPVRPGSFTVPGDISSQFVSGLLLALPLLDGDSEIVITSPLQSASYVDLTMDVMKRFGVEVSHNAYQRFVIKGGQKYQSRDFRVEADYSQAAFFLVASMLGCDCTCEGLSADSRQGDRRIIEILTRSGGRVVTLPDGSIGIKVGTLLPQTVDVSDIPDLVPPLAALLAVCPGTSRIVHAGRLRHKECDRLSAVTSELNALGANIEEGEDFLVINGVERLRGGRVNSHNDHRIAMMAAVAAVCCDGPVYVEDSGCVAKSYPNFWEDFERAGRAGSGGEV